MIGINPETNAAEHHYIRDKQHGFTAFDACEACYKLEKCREMLLIGLASYGEIDRLVDAQAKSGCEFPENLRVIHPTGNCSTTWEFAEALRFVDLLMLEIRDHTKQEAAKADGKPYVDMTDDD